MSEETINSCKIKMKKALEVFNNDLATLRTGRANVTMLDTLQIDVYGQKMSINQLATVSTPEPRLLTVQVWDQNNVPLIDSTIKKSNLVSSYCNSLFITPIFLKLFKSIISSSV